MLKSGFNLQS